MNLINTLQVYSYKNNTDDMFALFNDYVLDNRLNKDTLNKIIIKDLGSMHPITTDTTIFKFRIDVFFEEYKDIISKLIDTLELEYNPLYNKNIKETEHRESTGNIDNTDKYNTNQDNRETGNKTDEKQISAFDAITYQNKEKNTSTPNLRTLNDVKHEGETKSDIKSDVDTIKEITGKDGDTSIQKLIEEERKVATFNIYKWIINEMKQQLFLLIY